MVPSPGIARWHYPARSARSLASSSGLTMLAWRRINLHSPFSRR
jgi:hypothetical protein